MMENLRRDKAAIDAEIQICREQVMRFSKDEILGKLSIEESKLLTEAREKLTSLMKEKMNVPD